ncbi:hypothetical protein [Gracilibacillus lacisalsi]|uniref:hypothetical protein n=1 Tax=Gracilibacillus lacisalsi TaxID=393087 RepID=UPI0003744255|nr:hypothetical protein [Gracilibacillus lacisalsi]
MKAFKKLIKINDVITTTFLERQILKSRSRYFGGIIDRHTGIPSPTHVGTGSVIASWVSAYVNPESRYYHDKLLKNRIDYALDYMLTMQHNDGTISPGYTNYHSPPDTGFVVTGFSQIYHLLEEDGSKMLASKLYLFLKRSMPAMLTGGCHTPNHRWVLTCALANLYHIFNDKRLVRRAEEWLNEGLDITKDGEWTERSNGIYNAVSDISLYHTAILLNKMELLDHVRNNLKMMVYLVHPNGEIVTEYSGRQDLGNHYDLSPYHLIYRLMAHHDHNPVFQAMADLAIETVSEMGPVNNHILLGYLSFPFIQDENIGKAELPKVYEKVINGDYPIKENIKALESVGYENRIEHSSMHTSFGSPIVRYRNEDISATIMTKNPSFFSLRNGKAEILGIKMYTSFSPGLVDFDELEQMKHGYRLTKVLDKGYTGPIPGQYLPKNSEHKGIWYLLPHQYRNVTHNQSFEVTIDIVREGNDWTIRVLTDDSADVFVQIEFLFRLNDKLKGEGLKKIGDHSYFWEGNDLTLLSGSDKITLESGEYEHWQENIGSPKYHNLKQVKVNMISPINKRFRLVTSLK